MDNYTKILWLIWLVLTTIQIILLWTYSNLIWFFALIIIIIVILVFKIWFKNSLLDINKIIKETSFLSMFLIGLFLLILTATSKCDEVENNYDWRGYWNSICISDNPNYKNEDLYINIGLIGIYLILSFWIFTIKDKKELLKRTDNKKTYTKKLKNEEIKDINSLDNDVSSSNKTKIKINKKKNKNISKKESIINEVDYVKSKDNTNINENIEVKLTNKEERRALKKLEKTNKRLDKIENEKYFYWEHYEYLKKKPHYYRNIFFNKYYTTEKVFKNYKTDKDLTDFIHNILWIYAENIYKFLTQEENNKIRDVLIFMLNNYDLYFWKQEIKYSNDYHNRYIMRTWAFIASFIYTLYGDDKKWNLYYNICLDFCQRYYNYLELKLKNTKDFYKDDWIQDELIYYPFWYNLNIKTEEWFRDWKFLNYIKPI